MPTLPTRPPDDPLPLVADWLEEMARSGARNPHAMALATTSAAGRPSVRMVLLKELAPAGYAVFYTNYGSRKAAELEATGVAAAALYSEPLGRQLRFEGRIVRSPPAESDRYFASRPVASQLNAWSSRQSRPLGSHAELLATADRKARELGIVAGNATAPVPRPDFWGGYRLWLEAVELWAEGADRFHERLRYRRSLEPEPDAGFKGGPWLVERLQP